MDDEIHVDDPGTTQDERERLNDELFIEKWIAEKKLLLDNGCANKFYCRFGVDPASLAKLDVMSKYYLSTRRQYLEEILVPSIADAWNKFLSLYPGEKKALEGRMNDRIEFLIKFREKPGRKRSETNEP